MTEPAAETAIDFDTIIAARNRARREEDLAARNLARAHERHAAAIADLQEKTRVLERMVHGKANA